MRNSIRCFFVVLLFTVGTCTLTAQEDTLRQISDYVKEIQQVEDNNNGFQMAFWLPWQYWETAVRQTAKGKPLQASSLRTIDAMKNYNIFIVVESQKNGLSFTYPPENQIRDSLVLTVNDSIKLHPLADKDLPDEMKKLIEILKPVMQQSFGQMGENLNFFVFNNLDEKNKYYFDAGKPGRFKIQWDYRTSFYWRLPLDVLTPPKYCPLDNEKLSGKFIYCPYHGKKLESQPKK